MRSLATRMVSFLLACLLTFVTLVSAVACSGGGGGNVAEGDTGTTGRTIVINEVCTKNADPSALHEEDGLYCDWIELYNRTDTPFSLAGYGISDSDAEISHCFADGVTVPAKGYLVLWACGSTSTSDKSGGVNLPFALSKNGETLCLYTPDGAILHRMEIPALEAGYTYGYAVDGEGTPERLTPTRGAANCAAGDPTVSYPVVINEVCTKNMNEEDVHEEDGLTCDWIELYNRSADAVSLDGWGITDRAGNIKHYFAEGITVPAYGYLVLWACGAQKSGTEEGDVSLPFALSKNGESLYLYAPNGILVDSVTVPALEDNFTYARRVDGGAEWATTASSRGRSNDDSMIRYLDTSTISFSHESGFYGTSFRLTVQVPEGCTLYYTTDGSEPTDASPEYPTEGLLLSDASEAENVYSAMYMGTIEQCYEGYSKLYGIPSERVDKCHVMRFMAMDDDGWTTEIVTKSYFVGARFTEDAYQGFSVVSLVSDPSGLFGTDGDTAEALFTNSQYWKKTNDERQVNFAYFDADKQYTFDQEVGLRLHGTSTRGYNQKSMTLFARRKYGMGQFKEAILGGVKTCDSLVLRSDGRTKLQDGFLESFVSERDLSTCDYEPTVVFLDGEYYGVFNLMERFSEEYVEAHYGVDADNVYIVKKGEAKTWSNGGYADIREENVIGAFDAYLTTFRAFLSQDLSVKSNWEALAAAVDIESLIDYIAVQTYLCNMDWSFAQNIAVWRVADPAKEDPANPYADGKWRFVLYDLDFAAGSWNRIENWTGSSLTSYPHLDEKTNAFAQQMPFTGVSVASMTQIKNLMKSDAFVEGFVATFLDLCNVDFASKEAAARAETAIAAISPAMPKHFARFGVPVSAYYEGSQNGSDDRAWRVKTYFGGSDIYPTTLSASAWAQEMQYLVTFLRERGDQAREQLKAFCGLTGQLKTAHLSVTEPMGGTLYLHGRTVVPLSAAGTWQGEYYTDQALTVTAEAREGYVFTGWVVEGAASLSDATAATVDVTFTGHFTLTASFAPIGG